jgi:hypothetical protein
MYKKRLKLPYINKNLNNFQLSVFLPVLLILETVRNLRLMPSRTLKAKKVTMYIRKC